MRGKSPLPTEDLAVDASGMQAATKGGRRGMVSLLALDAEFIGRLRSWADSVERLARAGNVPVASLAPTRRRELFGRLIGNTDMHAVNLSFFARGTQVQGLTPVYDRLPTLYVPRHGNLTETELQVPVPAIADAEVWDQASQTALAFWKAAATEPLISSSFRRIAAGNVGRVEAFRKTARRLPS